MRVQRALAAGAVLVVTGLTLTACQDDAGTPAKAAAAPSTASAPAAAPSAPAAPAAPAAASAPAAAPASGTKAPAGGAVAACTTANLIPDVSVSYAKPPLPDLSAVTVSLVNKGDTCTLSGFPGVDLVTSEGATSVPRGRDQAATVTLAKAQGVMATVWYRAAPKGHTGAKVTTMTVTPPGETHPVKLTWPGTELAAGADARGTDTLFVSTVVRHG
ncbi:DUF4232 domain-containing protein [Kitasatospora sp. NPDC002227]|uniref:DUF4232 domain-containing protein n=1 Tax=Kitasatospora sp. NPDC002227 TaxID=3154773 RepID=UPI0033324C28